ARKRTRQGDARPRRNSRADGGRANNGMRIVVVDDEQLAREELCYQLERLGSAEVVAQAANGLEAIAAVERHEPDLVLLDVQMPGLTGFEVARRLLQRDDDSPALIFVTAFDQHAIEAFEVNAVDYLLKPVEAARLEQAVARARQRVLVERAPAGGPELTEQLDRIMRLMADRTDRREQVAVKVGERFMLVQAEEIIFASLADESITIVTGQ